MRWNGLLYSMVILDSLIKLCAAIERSVSSLKSIPSFQDLVDEYLSIGEMNFSYLTYDQYVEFTKNITSRFNTLLSLSSIGKSYEGNDIPLLQFKSNKQGNQGILFDGMHHGREPVSMMMSIYILLKLISDYNSLGPLFANTNIYFIPMINVDSYKYNCEQYNKTLNTHSSYSRKNRNKNSTIKYNCKSENIGVDLNRNYDYFFGVDNSGSSDHKCQEDYRGPHVFSEPETIAMRDFLISHKDIRIVLNYHSFGNLLITPFNYASIEESNRQMEAKFPLQYDIYKEFALEGNFPKGVAIGNGMKTIKYKANGDASDWMLGVLGIISFSPELGTSDSITEVFYPNKNVTFNILKENIQGAIYSIQKASYFLQMDTIQGVYFKCKGRINITNSKCNNESDMIIVHHIKINNTGLGRYKKEDRARIEIMIEAPNVTLSKLTIKISNNSINDLVYEQKANDDSNVIKDKFAISLLIDIESRKEAYMYIEIISNGLVNITYNKDNKESSSSSTTKEWIYNRPSLNISDKAFTLIHEEPLSPISTNANANSDTDTDTETDYLKYIVIGAGIIILVMVIYLACFIKRKCIDSDLHQSEAFEKQIKSEINSNFPSNNKNIPASYIELNSVAIQTPDLFPI